MPPAPWAKAPHRRRQAAAPRLQRACQPATAKHRAARETTMTPTRRPAFRGMLLALGLTTVMLTSGCDQVRQRLTPSATGQNATPPSPGPASSQSQPGSPPSASAAPATSTAPAVPVAPANPLTPMPPSSPTVAPTTPVERYSSHQGSSGVGPVERRQSSSGARP